MESIQRSRSATYSDLSARENNGVPGGGGGAPFDRLRVNGGESNVRSLHGPGVPFEPGRTLFGGRGV